MSIVIDRRLNDRNKNAVNRARFLRRYKEQIKRSVTDLVARRSITDMAEGGDVSIPARDISEPNFHHGPGGDREIVSPGNDRYRTGDAIPRPDGSGKGKGNGSGQGDGDGEDGFTFALSREEFMQLFFDDLELPNLIRTQIGDLREFRWQRAGYTRGGVPANLSIPRSLKNAMARRIALTSPLKREVALLEAETPVDEARVEALEARIRSVPFLDEIDLRFRHRERVPKPIARAVMLCLMDVSASMTEEKKDLAKRFFTLLYLFLTRKYEQVELVFIRHTDDAQEVDEETFFHDTKSGGTVVLSALKLASDIVAERYPSDTWNAYAAQVSDGDAFGADPEKSRAFLEQQLIPQLRYFAYVEVPDDDRKSSLHNAYERIVNDRFAMKRVRSRNEVYPVLRELFRREQLA